MQISWISSYSVRKISKLAILSLIISDMKRGLAAYLHLSLLLQILMISKSGNATHRAATITLAKMYCVI